MRVTILPLMLILAAAGCAYSQVKANYDTSWTMVYDGGRRYDGNAINDYFSDVKLLSNGDIVCAGMTQDSSNQTMIIRLNDNGNTIWKKTYTKFSFGLSLAIARNGDILVGGGRITSPLIMRIDSTGNLKWATWHYDSLRGEHLLSRGAVINSLVETSRGTIACAAGDQFPNNEGRTLTNYAAFLEFDSMGVVRRARQWNNQVGERISGFHLEEIDEGEFLLSGNESVFGLDVTGVAQWKKSYSFWLEGVGTKINNVFRAKKLRDGRLMVAGQAFEGRCWISYQRLFYDAWWSPITSSGGNNASWDTAGMQGRNDILYDFTQLLDGKIVFVGNNGNAEQGGIWAFVTAPDGKEILWETQVRIPYGTADGRAPRPLSVCAMPDSGFVVAGDYSSSDENGGMNGFVARFRPVPPTVMLQKLSSEKKSTITARIEGSRVLFRLPANAGSAPEVSVYNAAGRRVASVTGVAQVSGSDSFAWSFSGMPGGVYFFSVRGEGYSWSGKVAIAGK